MRGEVHLGPITLQPGGKVGWYLAVAAAFVFAVIAVLLWLYGDDARSAMRAWLDLNAPPFLARIAGVFLDGFGEPRLLVWWAPIPIVLAALLLHSYWDARRATTRRPLLPEAAPSEPSQVESVPEAEPTQPAKPLTLRERCETFADEMEGAIAKRDQLPYAIQARFGDYKYFLPRLRELRQELVYDKRDPPQPLNFANMLDELSRHDALRMVEALRSVMWDSPKKKPSKMRVVYLGPGDMVELDGIQVKKNEGIDLTPEQVMRIRADPTQRLKDVSHRYTGGPRGEYYVGIPARDLTEDDYSVLSAENQSLVDRGKLYSREGKG